MESRWYLKLMKSLMAICAASVVSLVSAQAPSPAPAAAAKAAPAADTKAAAVAGATAAEAPGAKAAPSLPPGSTAAPGWNNPPKWSEVEQKGGYASVAGRETNVLIEDHGHEWRALRNGPVTKWGGILLIVAPSLLLLFFLVKGPFKLHDSPTGRLLERFNSAERMAHWTMALSFVALAISGVVILWGKHILLPIFGASVFAWVTQVMKVLHNFSGPLFIFSLVAFFFIYVKDNFFNAGDFTWLSKFGGLLSGNELPSGRFNGGEKSWFWLSIVVFGIAISVTGLILLFPNWNTSRELMAQANIIHGIVSALFIATALAHIYMGTIGTQGAFEGMHTGYVDETWAREHHKLWYDEVKSGKPTSNLPSGAQPAAGDD